MNGLLFSNMTENQMEIQLEAILDVDSAIRIYALIVAIHGNDNLPFSGHNFYVYQDIAQNNIMRIIYHDFDETFNW